MSEELRQQRQMIAGCRSNLFIAAPHEIIYRGTDQCANGAETVVTGPATLIGEHHISKRPYESRRPLRVLRLCVLQTLSGTIVDLAHLPDEHLGPIVIGASSLLEDQCRNQRMPLLLGDQIHPSGVQCACLRCKSVQLDRRNPGERVSFASLLLQPVEVGSKLLDSLHRRLAGLSFHPVPSGTVLIRLPVQQCCEALFCGLADGIGDAFIKSPIDRRPSCTRGAHERAECRQFEPLPNQLLNRRVDDVGQILADP